MNVLKMPEHCHRGEAGEVGAWNMKWRGMPRLQYKAQRVGSSYCCSWRGAEASPFEAQCRNESLLK